MQNESVPSRVAVLDTETTGLSWKEGHRVVEIGIIEVIDRVPTGRNFHVYLDPRRDVPEEAYAVHGLSRDDLVKLSGGKGFENIADQLLEFVGDATIIAHNAGFDMDFLNAELANCSRQTFAESGNPVIDSLRVANLKYPGMANNLNALCNRLIGVGNYSRDLHGALLDASLLAQVYLTMTVQQVGLELQSRQRLAGPVITPERLSIDLSGLPMAELTDQDKRRHNMMCERIAKARGGPSLSPEFEMSA
jgi:DNA polymerase-3 subunit epsilon